VKCSLQLLHKLFQKKQKQKETWTQELLLSKVTFNEVS
jgi:hypothetical protein